MIETVDHPPMTVPVLAEKIRAERIRRHNELQGKCGYIPIHFTPDPTYAILIQLSAGAVVAGKAVGK